MADLLNIGLSGLSAAKTNLSVTGHNITNVNTPGYSRQDTVQQTRPAQFSGAGYIGSGTSLVDIRRSYSEFLTTQLRSSTALNADVKAYKSQIDQLDSLLAGSTTGITPSLQSFFSAMQTAAEDPSNIPARQLVLAEAEGLTRRFNNIYDSINAQNEFINKQMQSVTGQVNRLAGTVAELNKAIAGVGANSHPPNDLLDARDEAVRELATFIGVTVVPQDNNSLNLFIGSGQPLVVGGQANSIEAVQGNADPTRFDINFISGGSTQNISKMITGGEMGGLLRFREEVLDQTFNSVGRLALSINQEVNSLLGQGLDLKGNVGTALFNNINDPKLMGLRVLPMQSNVSAVSGEIRINNTKLLTASDYRLEYNGTGYSAFRISDGAQIQVTDVADPITNEVSLSFTDLPIPGRDQGFSMTLSGTPNPGDQFLLQPTRRGATDVEAVLDQADQLAFAAPLRSEANLQNKGTGTVGQPSVDMVLNNPATPLPDNFVADKLNLDNLQALDNLELVFNAATNELEFASLPAGVSITAVPQEGQAAPGAHPGLTITPGQTNTLSYAIQVNVGSEVQSYTVKQTISGTPQNGDRFSVSFNQHGVSDNRNALKLADLQNKQVVGLDAKVKDIATGMSFTDDYGNTIERVGTLTAQARQDDIATGAVLQQATDNRDSLSGVNLDEEAANLIKFEQYYNASAQIIQVARSLFDTLISTFR
ncbi:flagellar hook-associated protein FlgK [Thiopseudomonas acetoxidans]|uniref:Flagellar hook-associated protein 1 n=1 Tax=Thiopseudomonas acetoxidans TaxID=3041622 RepID=A0ABT7SQ96_9GAMM|nr:flagellar hook-associated protein FlgK [Thiopseudomonas sp. CY1220]MDM7858351.1 flagellar hook-associated protein FlgK [Thiopseudomonas sp. CY1220]